MSWRLISVIVIAIVMGLVFGGLRVASAIGSADQFGHVTQLAVLGQQDTNLAQDMENERDLTAAPLPHKSLTEALDATNAAAAKVKSLAAQIGPGFPASVQASAQAVVSMAGDLSGVREGAGMGTALGVVEDYSEAIETLFALNDDIAEGSSDSVLADDVRALGGLSRAKDEASQQRAILYAALVERKFNPPTALTALTSAQSLELADLVTFQTSATTAQQNTYLTTVGGRKNATALLLDDYVTLLGTTDLKKVGVVTSQGQAPALWYSSATATIQGMRAVEEQLTSSIVARSKFLENSARQSAITTALVTLGILLLVLIATLLVARSLVLPLRRLRAGALQVATVQLPARVRLLGESPDPETELEVAPINVLSTDEIGQVARAFDQVHAEAVRLAGNEAMLRGGLNAMFVSLSRRSMSLLERLARMIDSLEQNEEEPDRLSSLFSMDHLVTRMRRNSENLLVLAGHEPTRRWSEPVPLADVARAAASEIEQYGRVVLNVQPGIAVIGPATTDVVHLLAEIIENATFFSPRDTDVHVVCHEVASGGILIQVHDNGVGISETRLAELNWRLDHPPMIDVAASRHMGLFAVSRLAARHGIRARLRATKPRGLTVLVWLPESIIERQSISYGQPLRQFAPEAGYRLGTAERVSARRNQPALRGTSAVQARAATAAPNGTADSNGTAAPNGTAGSNGGHAAAAQAGGGTRSVWFRPKRPSSGSPGTPGTPGGTGATGGTAGHGFRPGNGTPAFGAKPGTQTASAAQAGAAQAGASGQYSAFLPPPPQPPRGPDQVTAAGLPLRTPQASRPARAPWPAPADEGAGVAHAGQAAQGSSWAAAPTIPAKMPNRTPEAVRGRLRGFQHGGRRAEEGLDSTGQGAGR